MTKAEPTLNDHQPGYAVLAELHRIQRAALPLSGTARFFAINPLVAEAKSWYTGYLGELKVGNRLNALRAEGYTVLHGVQPGKSDVDVDHLVITPTGFVYAINTKHHRGKKISVYGENKIWIGGHEQQHVRNSRSKVKKVLRYLDQQQAPISGQQGVLAFVAPASIEFKTKKRPTDIWLVRGTELVNRIKKDEAKRAGALPFDATPLTAPEFWRENYDYELLASQQQRTAWFADLQRQLSRRTGVQFAWVALALGLGAELLVTALGATGALG